MRDQKRYSYREKVEKLIEFIKNETYPKCYEDYPELKLTPKQYLKLYSSKENISFTIS